MDRKQRISTSHNGESENDFVSQHEGLQRIAISIACIVAVVCFWLHLSASSRYSIAFYIGAALMMVTVIFYGELSCLLLGARRRFRQFILASGMKLALILLIVRSSLLGEQTELVWMLCGFLGSLMMLTLLYGVLQARLTDVRFEEET